MIRHVSDHQTVSDNLWWQQNYRDNQQKGDRGHCDGRDDVWPFGNSCSCAPTLISIQTDSHIMCTSGTAGVTASADADQIGRLSCRKPPGSRTVQMKMMQDWQAGIGNLQPKAVFLLIIVPCCTVHVVSLLMQDQKGGVM